MHYTLVKSSLVSIAGNVPAPLMSALVQKKIWSFDTAWAYCGTVSDPLARTRALAALARLPEQPGVGRSLLLTQATDAAKEVDVKRVDDATDRAWAFAALIPCAPDEDRPALFHAVMAATATAYVTQRTHRLWILARLARHVPDLVRPHLLDAARSEHAFTDMPALAVAARWIPELRAPLRSSVMKLHGIRTSMCLLLSMMTGASEPERTSLLADARAIAAKLGPPVGISAPPAGPAGEPAAESTGLLAVLAVLLEDLKYGYRELRNYALDALLAELPESERLAAANAVVAAVRRTGRPADVAAVRVALSHLPEADRRALIDQTVGSDSGLKALCALAPYLHLSPGLLTRAVDLACAEKDVSLRREAFDELAPHLPLDLLHRVIYDILNLDAPTERAQALVRLAPLLAVADRQQAFDAVRAVDDPNKRVELLCKLMLHPSPTSIRDILEAVPGDAAALRRTEILVDLAMRATGQLRKRITERAVEAAGEIELRHPELRSLTEGVTDSRRLDFAFRLQHSFDNRYRPAYVATLVAALANLATSLADPASSSPDVTVDRAVRIAQAMGNPCDQSHAFATLVFCTSGALATTLLADALHAACADHNHVDGTFCRIEQRLADAVGRVPEADRLPLPGEFLADVLATRHRDTDDLRDIDPDRRLRQLTCLCVYLPESEAGAVHAAAVDELDELAANTDLGKNRKPSLRLLAPFLARTHLDKAVALAETLPDHAGQVAILLALAAHASSTKRRALIDRALGVAHADADPKTIRLLAPHRTPHENHEVLRRALELTRKDPSEENQARCIEDLAPHLPAALLTEASRIVEDIATPKVRAAASRALAMAGDPSNPDHWRLWRRALADAALVDRPTVLALTVDACLAVAGTSPPAEDEGDPTATRLARHLMKINRWWPGGTRSINTTKSLQQILVESVADYSSTREPWMSEYP